MYDAAGYAVAQVDALGNTTTSVYDALNRVSARVDALGNRATSIYDAVGQVTASVDALGWRTTAVFDAVGANGETWVYGYDHRNQLLTAAYSATSGGAVTKRVTFAYDSYGNKISREAWDGTTTSTERYGHDGWDTAKPAPIGNENFDVWVDLDGSNNLTTRRMYGPEF